MDTEAKPPVAVVVGVGPGLGAALVRRFAEKYRVAMIARSEPYLAELANQIAPPSGKAIAVPADVASPEAISRAFEIIHREIGAPEVLVYNAAMRPFGRLMETKPNSFEKTWRVTAFGAFLCAQEVVPEMIRSGRGVILFTGATAGIKPFATAAAFGPAKFAMRGLAQVMARDLGPSGIHVAYFNIDGAIDTLRRHGAAEQNIEVVKGPGAYEIPLAAKRMAAGGKYDAIIALGAVIRGGTPHFEFVAGECSKGLAAVMLESNLPVSFGVLTVDTIEQAIERAGTKAGNKGVEATLSAIEMVNVLSQL